MDDIVLGPPADPAHPVRCLRNSLRWNFFSISFFNKWSSGTDDGSFLIIFLYRQIVLKVGIRNILYSASLTPNPQRFAIVGISKDEKFQGGNFRCSLWQRKNWYVESDILDLIKRRESSSVGVGAARKVYVSIARLCKYFWFLLEANWRLSKARSFSNRDISRLSSFSFSFGDRDWSVGKIYGKITPGKCLTTMKFIASQNNIKLAS